MKDPSKPTKVLGIDIGGTNIRGGLVDSDYNLTNFIVKSSQQLLSSDSATDRIISLVGSYLAEYDIENTVDCISIGFPSTLDKQRLTVLNTPNIAGMDNMPIVNALEDAFGIRTVIECDVNMLLQFDMHNLNIPDEGVTIGIYVGTGLGNAIAIDGRPYIGKNGVAAELGHIPSRDTFGQCGCGNTSCVELFASGKHLQNLKEKHFPDTNIALIFTEQAQHPVIQKYVQDLTIPIAIEINILDPDYVILGGGVLQMSDFPKETFLEALHAYVRKPFPDLGLDLRYSVGGQMNGVIGAGIHAFRL